jgi:hypothetical protein
VRNLLNKIMAQAVLAVVGATAAPAMAESLASSASTTASMAGSSASTSLEASSGSSSKGKTAAAGDYRIEAVTVAADRPGMVRLALQPTAGDSKRAAFVNDERQPFVLVLPQRTAEAQGLARGDTVSVRERAYGFEFARADTRQAFYLVLADAWQHELDARPVDTAARAL